MAPQHILFVEPAGSEFNVYSKFMKIPLLGPLYLSTLARSFGYKTTIINENILERHISDSELLSADTLCLTCMTPTVKRGITIARQYKNLRDRAALPSRAIIGGIHPSMLPRELSGEFDCVVCGEGETVLKEVLEGTGKEKIITAPKVEDLDSLPLPDFSLVQGLGDLNNWPVMTSRGCPFTCNFCSVTKMFGRSYRAQSPERVFDEIFRFKSGSVFFVDDNFAADRRRTHVIVDGMIKYRFNLSWTAQVRTDITRDIDLVKKMAVAGCSTVYVGLESINPRSLLEMKKSQNLQDIKRALAILGNAGIQVHAMFMLGNDPDTPGIFKATSQFAKTANIDYFQCNVLTPLPGTELFDNYQRQGRLLHKNWEYYDGLHVVFHPARMSALTLQNGMLRCFSSFYNYSNALRGTVSGAKKILGSAGKNSSPFLRLASQKLQPSLMKIAGKSIIRSWQQQNSPYLQYLRKVCCPNGNPIRDRDQSTSRHHSP